LGAPEVRLDLHAIVDKLLLLKGDLQAFRCGRTEVGELHERRRYQIAVAMRQIGERAIAIEDVLMQVGCPIVVVTAGRSERERLGRAVHVFDQPESIDETDPFHDVLCWVTAVLNAADVVCLCAAGGRPDTAVDRDATRVERIAKTAGVPTGIVVARIVPRPSSACVEVEKNDRTPTRHVGS